MTDNLTPASNQVRFNWGFHDGASDWDNGRSEKFTDSPNLDRFYGSGYSAGYQAAKRGEDTDDSSRAFELALKHEPTLTASLPTRRRATVDPWSYC